MEKVLCISRADIPTEWLIEQSAIKMDEDIFLSTLVTPDFNYYWIDRSIAEKESSFKQIIPYVIIQSDNGTLTAIYRRKGSETRLHGLWSIGIGGHINPSDSQSEKHPSGKPSNNHGNPDGFKNKTDFRQVLYSGMIRELNEEIILQPHIQALLQIPTNQTLLHKKAFVPIFLGTINEDLTDVGKVHFGVVFKIMADSPNDLIAGEELLDFQWVKTEKLLMAMIPEKIITTETLVNFNMELWSQLAVQLF